MRDLLESRNLAPNFQALFESAPGLYLVLNPDFKIVAASDGYLRATMTKREAILGRGIFEVFPDNPNDPAATGVRNLRTSLERVLENGVSDTMAVQKYDIRRPESEGGGFEERYWSPVNSPVFGTGKDIDYIIHRVEDVTEFVRLKQQGIEQDKLTQELRIRAERTEAEVYLRAGEVQDANRRLEVANQELARLYEKTKELDQMKTRFFSNVSHELRTPLTLILGPTEKMLASSNLGPSDRDRLEVVARNARTLLRHVNDLLDVSKLEAGKMEVKYIETDLSHLLLFTASHFEALAKERKISLSVETPTAVPAQVDAEKVQRVFLNLLSNAFKFVPDGGRVSCRLRAEEGCARISFEDNGPGVPPELRESIFERFRQGEEGSTRRLGGTGLGLAIAREFLELQRGTIRVSSAPGGGALFSVTLPLLAPAGVRVQTATAEAGISRRTFRQAVEELRPASRSQDAGRGAGSDLVLVIEDNPDMNRFIVETLAKRYRTASAYDGREGLEKALGLKPDLILSDVMMPEMSGDQLVREIRAHAEMDAVPIILLTAKADKDLRVELLREGVQDYVTKPFLADELLARVENLIRIKKAREGLREELASRNQDVFLSEDRFHKAFNASPEPMTISTVAEGRYIDVNESFLRVTGYRREEVVGRSGLELKFWQTAEDQAALLHKVQDEGRVHDVEIRFATKSGQTRLGLMSAQTIEVGGQQCLLAVTKDITEHQKLEEQFRQSQKMEALGRLAGGIAHDFNNLLTIISGYSQLALQRLRSDDPLHGQIEEIKKAGERAASLTRQLLALSRRQMLAPQVLDLNSVVANSEKMLRRLIGEDIDLVAVPASGLGKVKADPGQIEQVILNLAVNARDAMPQGGKLTIETANVEIDEDFAANHVAVSPGPYVMLAVSDTGCGMDRETQARIFEPFFTTKEKGKGTGLGLSMVYGVVKQSGGTIWLYSEPGRGATFKIYLPRVNAPVEAVERAKESARPALGSETILLVEDEEALRRLARGILQTNGYTVLEARGADEALQLSKEHGRPIHLMLTDVVMPRISGRELAGRLAVSHPESKVLYMSGYTDDAVVRHGVLDQGTAFLQKPFAPDALARKVREVLDVPQDAGTRHNSLKNTERGGT